MLLSSKAPMNASPEKTRISSPPLFFSLSMLSSKPGC